jgi:hypothetical protein
MKFSYVATLCVTAAAMTGCITDKMVLANDQGQTQTCEFTGHVGLISPIVVHERYKHCIEKAKANGFKEQAPNPPA